jgi:hypothetical protein
MLSHLGKEDALPHLAQFAIVFREAWCFEGLRRLDTPRARDVLEMLAASRDPAVSELAAAALARIDQPDTEE